MHHVAGDAVLLQHHGDGLVGDGALNVVDADVIAEDRPRVRVGLFDGRAGEADERRLRQRVAQARLWKRFNQVRSGRVIWNPDVDAL